MTLPEDTLARVCDEREQLRAEVERLRALLNQQRINWTDIVHAAETHLAAANALLDKLRNAYDELPDHPGVHGYEDFCDVLSDLLAAQPATAPSRFDGWPPFDKPATAPVMRAAVTAEQAQQDALHALNRRFHRHETEQAVLDAWGAVDRDVLRHWAARPSLDTCLSARAELARRGLK